MTPRSRALLAFVLCAGMVAYEPLLSLSEQGLRAAFVHFAADAFYYLALIEGWTRAGVPSYDGIHATNGFHPLWLGLLKLATSSLGTQASETIALTFGLSIALLSVGVGLYALAVLRLTRSLALTLICAAPGLYVLLLPPFNAHIGPVWSFANGMESALSVFLFGALLVALVEGRALAPDTSAPRIVAISALVTAIVLARLDDAFLWLPLAALVAVGADDRRQAMRRLLLFAALPALVIGLYLATNLAYSGASFPVSGSAKNQGLVFGLLRNSYATLTTLAPFVDFFARERVAWTGEAVRIAQMLGPAAVALAWLVHHRRRLRLGGRRAEDPELADTRLIAALAAYVVLKAGYNFVLVGLWQQGHWYYPLSLLVFHLVVAVATARGLAGRLTPRLDAIASLVCVLIALLAANRFADLKLREHGAWATNHLVWERRVELAERLDRHCPNCPLIECDDGIFAFAFDRPTMSGSGLALDAEAFVAWRAGDLLETAYARGFNVLATANYPLDWRAFSDPAAARAQLQRWSFLLREPVGSFDFELLFVDPASGATFVRFAPRASEEMGTPGRGDALPGV